MSLEVECGEAVCLVGPNGAGKSTLLLHLNGTIPRAEGWRVRILGLQATHPHLKEVRRRLGVVVQDPEDQLFCPTVFEDVAFGPANLGLRGEPLRERVRQALASVEIPESFHDRLAQHLSIGEKKRVAIATVLAMDAEVLVLDEPSSDLDPAARRGLIRLLSRLPQTRLIATHDLELALEVSSRVVLLDAGRIVAEGPPAVILGDEPLMREHRLEVPLSLRLGAALCGSTGNR